MIGTAVSAWLLGEYACPHKDTQNSTPKKAKLSRLQLSTVSLHPGFEVKASTQLINISTMYSVLA